MNNQELAHQQVKRPSYENFFNKIYAFTTERISGYIEYFDLNNKSLLTVGSSSDQVLNAFYYGCRDITLLDINPFIEEFFNLKKTAIEQLDYQDFFKFMSLEGYVFKNYKAFNKKTFYSLADKIEDDNSKLFWKYLFDNEKDSAIRRNLFSGDSPSIIELQHYNKYLETEENYNELKNKIKNLKPKFIVNNIYNYHLNKKYDNIFLSNIADYNEVFQTVDLVQKLEKQLNDNGKLLISYLYQTDLNTDYEEDYCKIYNLEETLNLFREADIKTFLGVENFKRYCQNPNDSVLIYHKK